MKYLAGSLKSAASTKVEPTSFPAARRPRNASWPWRVDCHQAVQGGMTFPHAFKNLSRCQPHSGSTLFRKKASALSSGSPNHFRYKPSKSWDANRLLKVLSTSKRKSSSLRPSAKASGS